jgi:glycosyltransferase involved in cell wall biosynthesis
MKIAIAHHSLNIPGGAERLCLAVIEALLTRNYDVTLVTVEKTDWALVKKNFGNITVPTSEAYLTKNRISKNLTKIPISMAYFTAFVMQLFASKSKRKCDLVMNTFGDVINSVADVTYVHFPLRAAVEFSQIPAFSNKTMWQTVAPFYDKTVSLLDRIYPGQLLTNSKFMQQIIKETLSRNATVVYPPVNVESFSSDYPQNQKETAVAVVASYTPKRHLEQVPLIAKKTKHADFVIMGKTDEYSVPTLKKLKTLIDALQVKDRVKLQTNVPTNDLKEMLAKTKVYLHVMPYDHFGISVVEAMASGCVPLVHRSGGPWQDILDGKQGQYGYSYASAAEAADIIDCLVSDENLRSTVASRALNRAKEFDKTVFMRKIVEVVEKIAG